MYGTGLNEKKVIQAIADGLFVGYAIFDPKMRNKRFYDVMQGSRRPKETVTRALAKLEEKNLIYLGGEKITLTERGKRLLRELNFEEVIKPLKSWDGQWNLLSYDIPTKQKKVCDYFRRKLIEVGYTQVHKSLWIYPYDYKEEVAAFAHTLGIAPFIIYMKTSSIPQEDKYLKHFKLRKPTLKRRFA